MVTQTRAALAAIGAWTFALLLAAPSFLMFDGLPLSTVFEVVVLALALAALASGRCRSFITTVARRVAFKTVAAVVILGVAVTIIKIVLLVSAPVGG